MSGGQTVYYDHSRGAEEQPVFPRGEAGPVHIRTDGEWVTETVVAIGPNREYQQTLSSLQFPATTASRNGHGLRIRL